MALTLQLLTDFYFIFGKNNIKTSKEFIKEKATYDGDKILFMILREDMDGEHLHYDINYWGSNLFNKLMKKYKLYMEWENNYIASIYYDTEVMEGEEFLDTETITKQKEDIEEILLKPKHKKRYILL